MASINTNVQMVFADTSGDVQTFNTGFTDNGTDIFFELESQELEFGNRLHLKQISNQLAVFTRNGATSKFAVKADNKDEKPINIDLKRRVNIGKNINVAGHYMTFRWYGESDTVSPIFEGFYFEDVIDRGMVYE